MSAKLSKRKTLKLKWINEEEYLRKRLEYPNKDLCNRIITFENGNFIMCCNIVDSFENNSINKLEKEFKSLNLTNTENVTIISKDNKIVRCRKCLLLENTESKWISIDDYIDLTTEYSDVSFCSYSMLLSTGVRFCSAPADKVDKNTVNSDITKYRCSKCLGKTSNIGSNMVLEYLLINLKRERNREKILIDNNLKIFSNPYITQYLGENWYICNKLIPYTSILLQKDNLDNIIVYGTFKTKVKCSSFIDPDLIKELTPIKDISLNLRKAFKISYGDIRTIL